MQGVYKDAIYGLLHRREHDTAQDDALAKKEDECRWNRNEHKSRHHDPWRAAKLTTHLVEPNGERPVALALADK